MSRILLDTNICIYIIKKKPVSVRERFLRYKAGDIAVSSITVAELFYGAKKSNNYQINKEALDNFLMPLKVIPFDASDAGVYGIIRAALGRKGQVIGNMDMLIAAQAIAKGFTLVSNNLKEFARIDGLFCDNWV